MKKLQYDFIILGSGIAGLTLAYELVRHKPNLKIAILEKEKSGAMHASGRNSGVIHSGVYYPEKSFKAKFSVEGNIRLKEFCQKNDIGFVNNGKVIVAKNHNDLKSLYNLQKRGKTNGVEVHLKTQEQLKNIAPWAKTFKEAIYIPSTATLNSQKLCNQLQSILKSKGVSFHFNTYFQEFNSPYILTNKGTFQADYTINATGIHACDIASAFHIKHNFSVLPIMGLYLKSKSPQKIKKVHPLIYPVPYPHNAFLGVHLTFTPEFHIKIGPSAFPILNKEQYTLFKKIDFKEALQLGTLYSKLFLKNSFNFRRLALTETPKLLKRNLFSQAEELIIGKKISLKNFDWAPPGIRAQLINNNSYKLVEDFIIKENKHSLHILNLVSPGLTCSFSFAEYLVNKFFS